MTGAFVFAYFVLPFIAGGMGLAGDWLHTRASEAQLRNAQGKQA